jgi:hypothetical protein
MTTKFDQLIKRILKEAQGDADLPDFGQPDQNSATETDSSQMDQSEDMGVDDLALDKPNSPEETELGKLAIRALNFDIQSKDINQYKFTLPDGQTIPFEKISEYFEQTKDWRRVLRFVEWIINKYEGVNSQWASENELKGKNILQKLSALRNRNPENQMDKSKFVIWTRIILNALINGNQSMNLSGTDVNDENIKDVFNQLKQNFGGNPRGLVDKEIISPVN